MSNELTNFLNELSQLSQKYGMAISGCGCCGSPWVYDVTTDKDLLNDLTYDREKQQYY